MYYKKNLCNFSSCECLACRHNWPLYRDLKSDGPTLICSGCKSPVLQPQKVKRCLKCKKELKLGKLSKLMSTLVEDARKVIESLHPANVDKYLNQYMHLFSMMEANVLAPSLVLIVCQHVISQCFSYKGNFYQLDESQH